jgi:hypothetical protein
MAIKAGILELAGLLENATGTSTNPIREEIISNGTY